MSYFNHNSGVCVGFRDYQTILDDNERVEKLLENGLRLRRSNQSIKCGMILNTVYDEGEDSRWNPCEAIIPPDGIEEEGYVKEIWVESSVVEEDLGDESQQVISAYVHEPDQRILAFALTDNNSWDLLPSPEIVVKYYLKA
jgi:hypothetical protein